MSGRPEKSDRPEKVAEDTKPADRAKYGVISAAIAIIFGLFFAYDLFEAISNTIGVVAQINDHNQKLPELRAAAVLLKQAAPVAFVVPWGILIADLLISPILYAIAFLLGRRRGIWARAAIFLIALAAVAALSLSIEEGFTKLF